MLGEPGEPDIRRPETLPEIQWAATGGIVVLGAADMEWMLRAPASNDVDRFDVFRVGDDGVRVSAARGRNVYVVLATQDWTKRAIPAELRAALTSVLQAAPRPARAAQQPSVAPI